MIMMSRYFCLALGLLVPALAIAQDRDEDATWAFRPIKLVSIPKNQATVSPIDAFLLDRLHKAKLAFSNPASRETWLRRVSLDLTGLPPTEEEISRFLADNSREAYEKVVDRLLATPAFGERQATFWLDVVRYAETDGFNSDAFRPHAWRYRDYVIQSFNADKPYDRFVKEQLAGDELYPDDPEIAVATSYLRHYPSEYNAVNLENRRQEVLNDITDTTGQAFLGLTLGCARCHDHKFDPISHEDYYRIQAFFAGWNEVESPLLATNQKKIFDQKLKEWETKTAEIRREIAEIEKPYRQKNAARHRMRFPEEYTRLLDLPLEKQSPLERQLQSMIAKQVYVEEKSMFNTIKGAEKDRYEALKKKLAEAGEQPVAPVAMAYGDIGPVVPTTHLLKRGLWTRPGKEVKPGFLSEFDDRTATIKPIGTSLGRRSALAEWLVEEKNPLTSRVIVNRLWQQYFGKGIVATSGDFGTQGDKPTHPELLDWLARDLMVNGWSMKRMHRQIVLSQAYRQTSIASEESLKADPSNKLLSRMNRKRLDGETLRDAILAIAGDLNPKAGGKGIYPQLPTEMKSGAWTLTADKAERNRRSIYIHVKRNLRYPLIAAFDAPDRNETCSRRYETTTASQALMLLNDQVLLEESRSLADKVLQDSPTDTEGLAGRLYVRMLGREPTSEERQLVEDYLASQEKKSIDKAKAIANLCHALFNVNEFIYVD
jgi:hypothetical protein